MRSDPGVFCGALAVDTACAERGYWRWKFLSDAVNLADIAPVAHTAFKSDVTTQAIDLRERLFARDIGQWMHKTSYSATKWSGGVNNVRWYSLQNPGNPTNESMTMELNERLENLEIRLASQDDLLDALNQTVYRQQKKIDELDALCAALARRITDIPTQASGALPHEKPPHY